MKIPLTNLPIEAELKENWVKEFQGVHDKLRDKHLICPFGKAHLTNKETRKRYGKDLAKVIISNC